MKRLFAAIKITPDDKFLNLYYRLLKQLEDERIKWVEPQNMHITLKFFGETEEDRINNICDVLNNVSADHTAFSFLLKDIRIFGSLYKPRVIWFGIENNEPVKLFATDLLRKLETIGFENDRQNFVPHLTVGRIKVLVHKRSFQSKIDQFKDTFIQNVFVNKIYLFESTLTTSGPIYDVVECFRLR